jgi:hypothetical protein
MSEPKAPRPVEVRTQAKVKFHVDCSPKNAYQPRHLSRSFAIDTVVVSVSNGLATIVEVSGPTVKKNGEFGVGRSSEMVWRNYPGSPEWLKPYFAAAEAAAKTALAE